MARPRPTLLLEIVPVGERPFPLPRGLAAPLRRVFGLRAAPRPHLPLRPEWRDPRTGMVDADLLLDALVARHDEARRGHDRHWVLALVDADLGARERDFVLGVATVGGCCAAVATPRLREGDGAAPARFGRRVLTEAVHELGHVAGLAHCETGGCAMSVSMGARDVDRKAPELCPPCLAALRARRGEDGA